MSTVEHHYGQSAPGRLVEAITAGLAALGRSPRSVTLDDLGPVDEFHIGGRQATGELLRQLDLAPSLEVLDVGSGLGGAARLVASRHGCRVTGIDLTAEYVETARTLSDWVGLSDRVRFHRGSALATPFADAAFDRAYMLHVGMNIPDKLALFREIARVIKPAGRFGIYDVMTTGSAPLRFPVPWAATPDMNAIATPDAYRTALRASGLELLAERDRRDVAVEFFQAMLARMAQAGGPPPLGLHLLMGPEARTKIANMMANVEAGSIAPVEIIARKPA